MGPVVQLNRITQRALGCRIEGYRAGFRWGWEVRSGFRIGLQMIESRSVCLSPIQAHADLGYRVLRQYDASSDVRPQPVTQKKRF